MNVRIRMLNSKKAGASLQILKSPYVIGRHEAGDLRVGSPRVSVKHCAILARDRIVSVQDLGSTNGTRVNGEPVTDERELNDGDVVWVGPALIEVSLKDDELDILGMNSGEYTSTTPYLEVPRGIFNS